MLNINLRLENILCKNRLVSMSTIKEELNIKKNSSFIRLLMSELLNKLKELDYSTENFDLNYYFRLLNYTKVTNEEEFVILEEYIRKINQVINEKMDIFNRENNVIAQLLHLLHEQINILVVETKLGLIEYKPLKLPAVAPKTLRKIVCDLIFKFRNYDYLAIIFKNYTEVSNIKIKNQTIIFKLLELYIKDSRNRDFYAKTITMFLTSKNFVLSLEEKKLLLKKIAEIIDNHFLNKDEFIFMKEILFSIEGSNHDLERISMLNERYDINSVNSRKIISYQDKNIIDMRNERIITIDSNGAEILDDALSFKKNSDGTYELGIYITNLSPIAKGSKLDIHAYHQFSAIYLPDRVLHLFPEPMLKKNFSLTKGNHQVMAFVFHFTQKYELIDCQINEALINIDQNFNHIDVHSLLQDKNSEYYPMIKMILEFSEAINDTFSSIDKYHTIKTIIKELKDVCPEIPEKFMDTPGSRIVTANMIFLNQYLANYFFKNKLPFIYRVNEFEKDDEVLKLLLKAYKQDREVKKLLSSLLILYKKSAYSSDNRGHKGLGLPAYTQVTSPARLYVSLYIQRMLHDLFVLKMSQSEYIDKYHNVEADAINFTNAQERNREYIIEYTKLCKRLRIGLDKN